MARSNVREIVGRSYLFVELRALLVSRVVICEHLMIKMRITAKALRY